jgi:hypothetical protein
MKYYKIFSREISVKIQLASNMAKMSGDELSGCHILAVIIVQANLTRTH